MIKDIYNVSEGEKLIYVNPGQLYYIMDAGYFNEIRVELKQINLDDFEHEIKQKVFPYCDAPFARFIAKSNTISVANIQYIDFEEVIPQDDDIVFDTDIAILLVLSKSAFMDLVRSFDIDMLLSSIDDDPLNLYIKSIIDKYNANEVAIILCPGLDNGFDFVGSGTYRLVQ